MPEPMDYEALMRAIEQLGLGGGGATGPAGAQIPTRPPPEPTASANWDPGKLAQAGPPPRAMPEGGPPPAAAPALGGLQQAGPRPQFMPEGGPPPPIDLERALQLLGMR